MPTPPLSKARSASPRRARSGQHAMGSAIAPRAQSKPGTEPPRRPVASQQPQADFAFTHDPLSGSVTLHAGPDETRRILTGSPAEDPAIACRLGSYQGYGEPGQGALSHEAPVSWSNLEPAAVPTAGRTETRLVAPVPTPDAVN